MAVKVRTRNGASWIYVDFKGRRKAKRVGVGREGHRAALAAAEQIQARLALGDLSPLDDAPTPEPVSLQAYADAWLKTHASQACKFSTSRLPNQPAAPYLPRDRRDRDQ